MPTIVYKKSDLKKLIGRKISDEQLIEVITLIKPNLEKEDDDTITIEHTADRTDLFGIEGMARSISSYLGLKKGLRKYTLIKPKIELKMKNVSVRPYVSAMVVRKVDMTGSFLESMINIQELMSETLGRKRRKAAVGIHDFDKIKGQINYLGMSGNEKMIPLGSSENMKLVEVLEKTQKGKEYGDLLKPAKVFPVFTDSQGIFSLPPVINSERTKVTEKTKNLFVEVTGTEKSVVTQVMSVLASNFAERFSIEGVKLKHEKKSGVTPNLSESVFELSTSMANKLLGVKLGTKDIISLLSRMGYDAFGSADKIEVVVPPFRNDILHQVDLIEDVAIAHGYNNMKPELPNISTIGKSLELEKTCERASMALVGFGFQEIISSSLSNPSNQIEKMGLPKVGLIEIENPSSSEYTCIRKSLLPGLLKILAANKHYEYPQNIFEIGDVVVSDKTEETFAKSERHIAGVICHSRAGFAEIKSVIDGLMKSLERGYKLKECDLECYIPEREFDVFVDKRFVGSIGELHPQVTQNWDIGMPVAVFEISLEAL